MLIRLLFRRAVSETYYSFLSTAGITPLTQNRLMF